MTQFFLSVHWEKKIDSFWPKKLGRILVLPVNQLFKVKITQFLLSMHWEKKLSHFGLKSWFRIELSWDKNIEIEKKNIYCIGYPTGNGQSIYYCLGC